MLYAISMLSLSRQLCSAALGQGATAMWAKGLLLFRIVPRVAGEYVFADRAALLTARNAWCANPTTAAETYGPIGEWNVVAVKDMTNLFCAQADTTDCNTACSTFNEDLSGWNVGSGTNMYEMFYAATSFNGDVSSWNVGSVWHMGGMFRSASSFNGDLSNWNVGSVTDMYGALLTRHGSA